MARPNHDARNSTAGAFQICALRTVKPERDDVGTARFLTVRYDGHAEGERCIFHRDMLIIADATPKEMCLASRPEDVFIGSPPAGFPPSSWRTGSVPGCALAAPAALLEQATHQNMVRDHPKHKGEGLVLQPRLPIAPCWLQWRRGRICSSAPRRPVSARETLPGPVYDQWDGEDRKPDA